MYYYKSPSCPFDIPQKINQGILLDDCHYKYINLITIDTLFVRLDIYRKSNRDEILLAYVNISHQS